MGASELSGIFRITAEVVDNGYYGMVFGEANNS